MGLSVSCAELVKSGAELAAGAEVEVQNGDATVLAMDVGEVELVGGWSVSRLERSVVERDEVQDWEVTELVRARREPSRGPEGWRVTRRVRILAGDESIELECSSEESSMVELGSGGGANDSTEWGKTGSSVFRSRNERKW